MQIVKINNNEYYINTPQSVLNLIEEELGVEVYRACSHVLDYTETKNDTVDDLLKIVKNISDSLHDAQYYTDEMRNILE